MNEIDQLKSDIHFYENQIKQHEHHLSMLNDGHYKEYEQGLVDTWQKKLKKMQKRKKKLELSGGSALTVD